MEGKTDVRRRQQKGPSCRPGPDWQYPSPDQQTARPERSARPLSPGKYSTQKGQPLKNFAAMPPPMELALQHVAMACVVRASAGSRERALRRREGTKEG